MPLPRNDCDAMVDTRALQVAPGDHRDAGAFRPHGSERSILRQRIMSVILHPPKPRVATPRKPAVALRGSEVPSRREKLVDLTGRNHMPLPSAAVQLDCSEREPDSNHRFRSCERSVGCCRREISWMGSLSTGRLARRRWSAAGPLSTAVSFSAGPMVRIRFPPPQSDEHLTDNPIYRMLVI